MSPCCDSKVKPFHPEQKYKKLLRKCRKAGVLFEDDKFAPSGLLLTNSPTGFETISYFRARHKLKDIEWLRPHEIVRIARKNGDLTREDLPVMETEERNRFDINQGELGDCWFLAPLALLAESKLCQKVVPPGQGFGSGYQGIFKFRFYRLGEWIEVVIDDRLPTRNGKLIYLRGSRKNQFWAPLLEKAYAKLNGSYAALEGGVSIHAAVDFTGGIPRVIDIEQPVKDPNALFQILKQTIKNDGLVTCALGHENRALGERLGLQGNHSYSVTKVVEVRSKKTKESMPLVRLRNPHGNGKEWMGDWSDTSTEWKTISRRKKKKLGLEIESDGEFYMNFNRDFLTLFGSIDMVHVNPIRMELADNKIIRKFNLLQYWGKWEYLTSAGGVDNIKINPRYHFSLDRRNKSGKDCAVIISLAQEVLKRSGEHHIGFRVYKYKDESELESPNYFHLERNLAGKSGTFVNSRETSETFYLEEGNYVVVPSTYHRYKVAKFHLRIYIEYRWKVVTKDKTESVRDKNCCFWCCKSFIKCTCCSTYCYQPRPSTSTTEGTTEASSSCCGRKIACSSSCCARQKSCCSRSEDNSKSKGCCRKKSDEDAKDTRSCMNGKPGSDLDEDDVFRGCCGSSRGARPCCRSRDCCCRCSPGCCPCCGCCCCCDDDDDYYYRASDRRSEEVVRMIPIQRLNQNHDAIENHVREAVRAADSNRIISLAPQDSCDGRRISCDAGSNPSKPYHVYSTQISTEIRHFYHFTHSKEDDLKLIKDMHKSK